MLTVLLAWAYLMSHLGERWLLSLYRTEAEVLSFPAKSSLPSPVRRLPLTLALGMTLWWLGQVPISLLDLLGRLILIYVLLLTIITDFEQQVVFDRMLLPLAFLSLPFFALLPPPWWDRFLAAVLGGLAFLLLAIVTRGGIGGGDIKLIFVLGLWLGMKKLLFAVGAGIILSGVVAVVMLLLGRWKSSETLAYSPYFSLAAIGEMMCYL